MAKKIFETQKPVLFRCVNCGYEEEDVENPACPIACPKCHAGRMAEVPEEE